MALSEYNRSLDQGRLVRDANLEVLEVFYPPHFEDIDDAGIGDSSPIKKGAISTVIHEGKTKLAIYQGDGAWLITGESNLELGTTNVTAHRGDHGKAAYEHSLEEGNPHKTKYKDLIDIPEPPGFNFNLYNAIDGDMSQPLFEFPLGSWNSTVREIGNVLKDDNGDLYWTYSGYEGEYSISDQPYIGALKSIDNGKTWSDLGKITEQGFEDPYLIKHEGVFMLYSEKKRTFASPVVNLGINLHSGGDIMNLSDNGVIIDNGISGRWDGVDRSSPTIIKGNDVFFMLFEGRGPTIGSQSGAVGLATSEDGVVWSVGEYPTIVGYQYNIPDEMSPETYRVPWVSHIVPDDIINIGDKYMLSAHAYNGRYFTTILLFSNDLIHWKDEKGTWINYSLNNTENGGNGISFYKNEEDNSLNVFFIQRSEGTFKFYKGSFYNRKGSIGTDYAVLDNQKSAYKIVGAQRDEVLEYNNTINSARTVFIGYDINCAVGISKTIKNSSNYNITIQGDPGVSLNGVTEGSYIIRPKSTIKIIAVGVNVWAVQFQEITLQENGNWGVEAPLEISKQLPSTTSNVFEGAHIKARVGNNPANSVGVTSVALPTSYHDNYGVTINALRYGTSASPALSIRMHNNSSPGVEVMRVLEDGRANLPGSLGLGLGFTPPTEKLEIGGNVKAEGFKLSALNSAPTSSTDIGTAGEIRITATHIYVCVATNTWVRSELATW